MSKHHVKVLLEWLENSEPIPSISTINAMYGVLEDLETAEAEVKRLRDLDRVRSMLLVDVEAEVEHIHKSRDQWKETALMLANHGDREARRKIIEARHKV